MKQKKNLKRAAALLMAFSFVCNAAAFQEPANLKVSAAVEAGNDLFNLCIENKEVILGKDKEVEVAVVISSDTSYRARYIGASITYDERLELLECERREAHPNLRDDGGNIVGITCPGDFEAGTELLVFRFKVPEEAGEYKIRWYHPQRFRYNIFDADSPTSSTDMLPYGLIDGKVVVKDPNEKAPEPKNFTFGRDNWNFINSDDYFPQTTYREQINDEYLEKLKSVLTNSEYEEIFKGYYTYDGYVSPAIDDKWGGSCYGMSATTFLSYNDFMTYSDYTSGASSLHEVDPPLKNENVMSLLTYYQMLQYKDNICQKRKEAYYQTNRQNIETIMSEIDKNGMALVGFTQENFGGHAILAYGYKMADIALNGKKYIGCISICDPNLNGGHENINIYFDSGYNWLIPAYRSANINSLNGAKIACIIGDIKDINNGGYLEQSSSPASAYSARLNMPRFSGKVSVEKTTKNDTGKYVMRSAGIGDIVENTTYIANGQSEGMNGYDLFDANSGYHISQTSAEEMEMIMKYEDCMLISSASAGKDVIFDKNGLVSLKGSGTDYAVSMTFDKDYPTDWSAISVKGTGADEAKLEKQADGYMFSADSLKDITVKMNNREDTAELTFSTEYDTVYIYETDKKLLGVKADTDGDGVFEKIIAKNNAYGDVNSDNVISASDITALVRYILDKDTVSIDSYDADVNKDGSANVADLMALKKLLVE